MEFNKDYVIGTIGSSVVVMEKNNSRLVMATFDHELKMGEVIVDILTRKTKKYKRLSSWEKSVEREWETTIPKKVINQIRKFCNFPRLMCERCGLQGKPDTFESGMCESCANYLEELFYTDHSGWSREMDKMGRKEII